MRYRDLAGTWDLPCRDMYFQVKGQHRAVAGIRRYVHFSSCRRKLEWLRGRAVCEGGTLEQRQGGSHGVRLEGRGRMGPMLQLWPKEAGELYFEGL